MSDLSLETTVAPPSPPSGYETIRDALLESRQRWRHLVGLAVDLAFETDEKGRFVFVMPDDALGWPAGSLIGQPSDLLLGRPDTLANPLFPASEIRRRRCWLRCADGGLAMMAVSAAPLCDIAGRVAGSRGIAIDLSGADFQEPQLAARLRRGEVLDQMLGRISREMTIDAMMDAALWTLVRSLGAEGAAVIGCLTADGPLEVLHECGSGASAVLDHAARMLDRPAVLGPIHNGDGRIVLVTACPTRFGTHGGLAIWRAVDGRVWDEEDVHLAGAATGLVRMILEYETVQNEMAVQARTDPLTELLNRRAFLEELRRHMMRLDRENAPGTMVFIDLDGFKSVNDRLGHAMGDKILVMVANRLRRLVRPNDLIARLGGDEFALWLSGVDQMTGAERADTLCKTLPGELQAAFPDTPIDIGVSVGIAKRRANSDEPIDDLMRRADAAMYDVKRGGRGHWRVSLLEGD